MFIIQNTIFFFLTKREKTYLLTAASLSTDGLGFTAFVSPHYLLYHNERRVNKPISTVEGAVHTQPLLLSLAPKHMGWVPSDQMHSGFCALMPLKAD